MTTTTPPPNAKRQRTNDDGYAKESISTMLFQIRDSETEKEAEEAMEALSDLMKNDSGEALLLQYSKDIFNSNGVPTTLIALSRWFQSRVFAFDAIRVLASITCYEPKSREVITDIGGIRLLLNAVLQHAQDSTVAVIGIVTLDNIAFTLPKEVNSERCIDFVMEAMKKHETTETIQELGCNYFAKISKHESTKEKLQNKGIISLLSAIVEKSRRKNDEVFKSATNVLKLFLEAFWD